ncbi:MAG: nucleoside triphosphate pyrophosphohydrolase [Bacteroidetes bacterium]|nr:nucleoside triphosphate pyrophosphohydrolase [Bacteroidota bacterium]
MKHKIPIPDNPDSVVSQMENFIKIVKLLRQDCPWDHEQSHNSLSHLLIEEAYEAVDAINRGDMNELTKELGDILLHIVMHSVIASETNEFSFIDVIKSISNKMIYRHPHVFEIDGNDTGSEINTSEQVLDNWEKRKMKEGRTSVLEGVPADLPSLLRAERIQEKAARVGFDWINKQDVWAKVHEELGELKEEIDSNNQNKKEAEFGDVFFALVNAARFEKIVPEHALQITNLKFTKRFQYIEKRAKELNLNLSDMSLEEMDRFWNEAKQLEKEDNK